MTPPHKILTSDVNVSRRYALGALGTAAGSLLLVACGDSSNRASSATSSAPSAAHQVTTTSAATATTSVGGVTSTSLATCAVLTKEQEQGPYWYPAAKVRPNITDGKAGAPMKLVLTVMDVTTCKAVPNAGVDVWMADALGAYSDTSTGLFLRGIQITGNDGISTFSSIYPGWYPSRTNHVHVKVHIGGAASTTYVGGHVSHTGNLFFPEDVSVAVAKVAPYTDNPTKNRVKLTDDFVYKGQNGSGSIMTVTPNDPSDPTKGYVASMVLGIDPSATPAGIGIAGTVK